MNKTQSRQAYERAQKVIPGGVNSPVRAFQAVGGEPIFIERAQGAYLYDIDGHAMIDYIGSWGPMIVGHAHPVVLTALHDAIERGTSYGAPNVYETILAEMILDAYPSMEMVRMVNSGTEATMSALRLARGYTGRNVIVKVEGCYHGHADYLLIKAGSGATTFGVPTSPGVPADFARNTIVVPFNDLFAIEKILHERGNEIAAIIIEPIPGNMGLVLPGDGYLAGLRELTRQHGVLLIFDEVMTGFRVAYGGAQERFGIDPDLTCLGKIIGGGLPVGAYGGKREIMSQLVPIGPVYQAGTLSGNPLAMVAGIATLNLLQESGTYERLEVLGQRLENGTREIIADLGLKAQFYRCGSMFGLFFTEEKVVDYRTAYRADTKMFAEYFQGMLNEGVYLAPSQFEAGFISLAHTEVEIDRTVEVSRGVLQKLLRCS